MKNDIFGYRMKSTSRIRERYVAWMTRHYPELQPPTYARHGDWRSRKNQKKMLRRIRQAYRRDERPNVKWLTRRSLRMLMPSVNILPPIANWRTRGHRTDGIILDDFSPPACWGDRGHA